MIPVRDTPRKTRRRHGQTITARPMPIEIDSSVSRTTEDGSVARSVRGVSGTELSESPFDKQIEAARSARIRLDRE